MIFFILKYTIFFFKLSTICEFLVFFTNCLYMINYIVKLAFVRKLKKVCDLMTGYKQCIVTRSDLKLSSGKLAVQVAHAAVSAADRASSRDLQAWKDEGQKKIVLKVPTLQDLFILKETARREGLPNALISDAGHTEIDPGTVTVLGIGPAEDIKIDRITGHLKML